MRRSRRVAAGVWLVMILFLGSDYPAAAIGNHSDGNVPWREPGGDGDLTWQFDTNPPGPSSVWDDYRDDVRWAAGRWNGLEDGFGADLIEVGSGAELRVSWEDLDVDGPLGSLGAPTIEGFNRCGAGLACDLRINSNGAIQWQLGATVPSSSEVHHRSVVLHEFGHALGLGHSRGSNMLSPLMASTGTSIPVMYGFLGQGMSRDTLTKDDCSSVLFQEDVIATCNNRMDRRAVGTDDPEHFGGWGFGGAWEYQSCASGGGLPAGCHWRMRAYPNTSYGSFGAFYDVEGPEDVPATSVGNPLRSGERFRVRFRIGVPDYNSGTAEVNVCLYLRIESQGSNQQYKPGQVCRSLSWSGYSPYTWYTTAWYDLPETVTGGQRLRTYIVVGDGGSIYLTDWQVQRERAEG